MAGGPGVGSGTSVSAHNHAATRATLTSAEVTGSTGMTRSVGGDMGVTAAVQSESDSSGCLPGLAECCLGGRSGSCRSGPQCPRPPQTPCEDKGAPQGWEGWEVQFGGRLLAHGGMAGHLLLPGRTRPTPPRCPPSAPRGTGHGTGRGGAQGPGQAAHLERSWLEPRLSTGEMLAEWAECRRAACLLGDAGRDPALAAVRDRDRLFFFFSWGLLEGKRA